VDVVLFERREDCTHRRGCSRSEASPYHLRDLLQTWIQYVGPVSIQGMCASDYFQERESVLAEAHRDYESTSSQQNKSEQKYSPEQLGPLTNFQTEH
jgi:hypothetical protein